MPLTETDYLRDLGNMYMPWMVCRLIGTDLVTWANHLGPKWDHYLIRYYNLHETVGHDTLEWFVLRRKIRICDMMRRE